MGEGVSYLCHYLTQAWNRHIVYLIYVDCESCVGCLELELEFGRAFVGVALTSPDRSGRQGWGRSPESRYDMNYSKGRNYRLNFRAVMSAQS
jgi:hypothetical protein